MKNSVKISIFAVTFFLFMGTSLLTQAQGTNDDYHAPDPGDKALQFQISENFSLGSFEGSALSLQNQITEKRAHRLGISLTNLIHNTDFGNNNGESTRTRANFNVSYTWKTYTNPTNPIKFYYGMGPTVTFLYDRHKDDDPNFNFTETDYSIGIGALGYAGTEWFFHPSMSLHAEYRLSLMGLYQTTKETQNSQNSYKSNSTNLSFSGNGVAFGLSVYF